MGSARQFLADTIPDADIKDWYSYFCGKRAAYTSALHYIGKRTQAYRDIQNLANSASEQLITLEERADKLGIKI